jgi:hypothetical protein
LSWRNYTFWLASGGLGQLSHGKQEKPTLDTNYWWKEGVWVRGKIAYFKNHPLLKVIQI